MGLFHHVLVCMGDLHLVLTSLILSILDAGILIMVQQLKLMMFSLNMDYPTTHVLPLTVHLNVFCGHIERTMLDVLILFEFCFGTHPSWLKVVGWWPNGTGAGTKIMGGHHPTQARMIPLLSQSIIVPTVERPGSRFLTLTIFMKLVSWSSTRQNGIPTSQASLVRPSRTASEFFASITWRFMSLAIGQAKPMIQFLALSDFLLRVSLSCPGTKVQNGP